jgi:RNA polymerase sigma-70 factor (ECF subfamily)
MEEQEWLAETFEGNRDHLRAVAYRMLGSAAEAEDAVQESWLRLSRAGASGIENIRGWLTTIVARVCLDMLRSRRSRREEKLGEDMPQSPSPARTPRNPEQEAIMADSVGLALLVVLDRLSPAERLAFVLHDLFGMSFDEVAETVGRSPEAARQLASRARRRVHGLPGSVNSDFGSQRALVSRFLSALRSGDLEGLLAVLDPDLVVTADSAVPLPGQPAGMRSAEFWAPEAIKSARGARFGAPALIDGAPGILIAPYGRLFRAMRMVIRGGKIAHIEVIGEKERLRAMEVSVLAS